MICTTHFRNADPRYFDEIWAIKPKWSNMLTYITHVPELAPDTELIQTALRLRDDGNWNVHTFQTIYKPKFMQQMQRPEAQKALDLLKELDAQGKKVCLFCYCNDKNLCHRSLVAELLVHMGCNVIMN